MGKKGGLIGKKFDSEPVWGDKYINAKIKIHRVEWIQIFKVKTAKGR